MIESEYKKVNSSENALVGFVTMCLLVTVGFLLSLTVIGAIIGIPLMLAGFGTFVYGVTKKEIVYVGNCPVCKKPHSRKDSLMFRCDDPCKRVIVINEDKEKFVAL